MDGNTRTRYYRDSSGYGNETSDVQQINIYDEYGYLISSKYYHSSGELWYDFIWIRDRWKILTSKRYLYQDLNRDWKYEWSDLEVKRYDRLNNNNLMLTSKYDDKSRVLSINWVDGRENLYEYDLSYRFRVKEEILDKEPLYSYNWSENICEKFNHKQNKITNIFEVNEFDDIIKDFDENYNLLGTKEYLTERFTDPFVDN